MVLLWDLQPGSGVPTWQQAWPEVMSLPGCEKTWKGADSALCLQLPSESDALTVLDTQAAAAAHLAEEGQCPL